MRALKDFWWGGVAILALLLLPECVPLNVLKPVIISHGEDGSPRVSAVVLAILNPLAEGQPVHGEGGSPKVSVVVLRLE